MKLVKRVAAVAVGLAVCLSLVSPAYAKFDWDNCYTEGTIADIYVQTGGVCVGGTCDAATYKTRYIIQLANPVRKPGCTYTCAPGKFATYDPALLGVFEAAKLSKQKVRVWGGQDAECPLSGSADTLAVFKIYTY